MRDVLLATLALVGIGLDWTRQLLIALEELPDLHDVFPEEETPC